MGRTADEIISYVSDAAAFLTGNPFLAVAGNSLGAGDAAISGRNKDALSMGLGAVTAGVAPAIGNAAENIVDPILQASPLDSATADLASNLVQGAGSLAGGAAASQAIEPGLASLLGISQPSTPASAPTTMKTVTSSGSGGAGAGGPPGGLSISGSTAPNVQPWVGQNSSSTGGSTQNASQQQTKGI